MWTLESFSQLATPIGVFLAFWQLRRSVLQAKVDFEDDLNREYRELTRAIPPEAQAGGKLESDKFEAAYPYFYQYFDLSNEQVFLRKNGRISRITWINWRDGIQSTMAKQTFTKAWLRITESSENFSELRQLVASEFADDPYDWIPVAKRVKRWLWQ